MFRRLSAKLRSRGQGLAEYALILVLVAVVVILIVALLGDQISDLFCGVVQSLDPEGASSIEACAPPVVSCSVLGTGAGTLNVEAVISPDADPVGRVEFFLDGSLVRIEVEYHYCLGSGNSSCNDYSTSSGSHTVQAVAYTSGGEVIGQCTLTVSVP